MFEVNHTLIVVRIHVFNEIQTPVPIMVVGGKTTIVDQRGFGAVVISIIHPVIVVVEVFLGFTLGAHTVSAPVPVTDRLWGLRSSLFDYN